MKFKLDELDIYNNFSKKTRVLQLMPKATEFFQFKQSRNNIIISDYIRPVSWNMIELSLKIKNTVSNIKILTINVIKLRLEEKATNI